MNSSRWWLGVAGSPRAGGLANQPASIVATDGAVTGGPYPEAIGGFTLVEVPSREEAADTGSC